MTIAHTVPPPSPPRPLRAFGFLLALLMLGVIAIVALRTPPRIITGLPAEPSVAAARALVHDRLAIELPDLRFETALLGRGAETNLALATEAGRILDGAHERGDPRVPAA
ncbi:MAG TPA: hypothetical protein VJY35_00305, partial [Candidatus Eisenbacteria bacterium]|nr:hypothetical protein [Candidatus Eisenbacteria bacterium]